MDNTEAVVKCLVCDGIGWVPHEEGIRNPEIVGYQRCLCLNRKLRQSTLATFGTEYCKDATFLRLEGVALRFYDLVAGDPPAAIGGLLLGPVGTGKSFTASAVVNNALQFDCKKVVFAGVPALLYELQRAYGRRDNDRLDEIDRALLEADLLVLDDLGAEKPTEWTLSTLYRVISDRWGRKARTIATANCFVSTLQDQVGVRIMDRLMGFCGGMPVVIEGGSRRW